MTNPFLGQGPLNFVTNLERDLENNNGFRKQHQRQAKDEVDDCLQHFLVLGPLRSYIHPCYFGKYMATPCLTNDKRLLT